ncbi:MAG TPA: glycosyltransferase family 2 protein [Thermoanaerobaculia bacterium]|nr:glycosyltransferase family 2 protein [Thermoanaerobaculia bacterium]
MIQALLVVTTAAGAICLALLAVNLWTIPRLSEVRPATAGLPRVSIIIPARNEERSVEAAVRSHLAQRYADFEVIVVDDRSSDRTGEIVARIARDDPRLTVVACAEPPPGWHGKPHALYRGAQVASGGLLLFADADVVYHPEGLGQAVTLLEEGRIDLLAVMPRIEAEGFWENVLMPPLPAAIYLGAGFLLNLDRPRWIAAGGGAGNLIRRTVYEALGGHEALKNSVIDDVRLALNARQAGHRTRAVRAEDRISVHMYRGFREVCDGFTKNIAYVFQGAFGLAFAGLTGVTLLIGLAPALTLAAALLGAPVPRDDVVLAAAAYGLMVSARLAMALAIGSPLWPAWTHPIMAVVWAGIIGRSLYDRVVRRRLTWRGREFDARAVRF